MKARAHRRGRCGGPAVLPLGAIVTALAAGPAALGQSAAATANYEWLRPVVVKLDDASFDLREEATKQLKDLVGDDVGALQAFLQDGGLSSEQRYRLLQVYSDKLLNRPRGALGISMNPRPAMGDDGVEIMALVQGMPAEEVLKVGDVIREIDGELIRDSNDLRWHVQTKKPGDFIMLVIDRPRTDENGLRVFDEHNNVVYDRMRVEFELGSLDRLNEINGTNVGEDGQVQQERQARVEAALRSFSPPMHEIEVRNKAAMIQAMLDGPNSSADVDDHPIIVAMMQDVERIVKGNLPVTAADLERWNAYQSQLAREYSDPDISRAEQEYLLRVIKRFLELRPPTMVRDINGRPRTPSNRGNRPPR